MDRHAREVDVVIADGQSQSAEFVEVDAFTMFAVFVPTGTEGTHLQILEDQDGTAKVAKDDEAALKIVAFTVDQWVDLPTSAATMHRMYLKTCSAVEGTAQAQTGAATLTVRCKA